MIKTDRKATWPLGLNLIAETLTKQLQRFFLASVQELKKFLYAIGRSLYNTDPIHLS